MQPVIATRSGEEKLSFHKPTRLELAMHEAGHAYAFATVSRYNEPNELGLGIGDAGDHHGWCSRNTLLHKVTLSRVPLDVLPHIHWAAAAEIVVAIAGSIAEFRHRHRSRLVAGLILRQNAGLFLKPGTFDTDGDFERIRSTLAYIQAADPIGELRRMMDIGDTIVAANWPSITKLGRHLLTCGVMNGDELADWFRAHPMRPYDGDLAIDPRPTA